MKQGNYNEVDLLLRSLARGRDEGPLLEGSNSPGGNREVSNHLDADELNSYAEGVLPSPARARYTEHLADCDMCRGIVVRLTAASGKVTRSPTSEQEGGLGFWQKLAVLFSPAVLRYAAPALVLTAVIGIGLVVWQQRRQPEFIAQNQPADAPKSAGQLHPTESPAKQSSIETLSTIQKRTESAQAVDSVKEQNKLQDEKTQVAPGSGAGTGRLASSAPIAKDAGQLEESASRSEQRPGYAPEPKASAPPTVANTVGESDKLPQLTREQPAKLEDQARQREAYKNTPTEEHGPNRSAAPRTAGAPLNNRRLDGLSAGRGGLYGEKKDKAGEVETRTVSGRRFVREANTWVDAAYDSSRTPIKVARGSEQFRALVADEPDLRVIAERLSGVVIVVWKNRAYRIQ